MRRISSTVALLALLAVAACVVASPSPPDCSDALAEPSFDGICSGDWRSIRPLLAPTQPSVGFAWVARILDEDFKTAKDAQAKMDASAYTPCIIGPGRDGPRFFLLDDHHTLCALDFSGFKDTTLILNVSCDLRSLTRAQFSEYLQAHAFVYLASPPNHNPLQLPVPIPFEQLPQTFHFTRSDGAFLNDPWRSLVGFARKVAVAPAPFPACAASDYKYCMRCMLRGCGSDGLQKSGQAVAFFEFKWSYYMASASFYGSNATSYWPSLAARDAFISSFNRLPLSSDMSSMDGFHLQAWADASSLLVPLCRANNTAAFKVPADIFPADQALQGVVVADAKLAKDPDCINPVCAV